MNSLPELSATDACLAAKPIISMSSLRAAQTKRRLAELPWKQIQDYADAKSAVIEEILTRAQDGT